MGLESKLLLLVRRKDALFVFDVLTQIGIVDGSSVLDVGCGFADYFDYANELGINIHYTGIDIVS